MTENLYKNKLDIKENYDDEIFKPIIRDYFDWNTYLKEKNSLPVPNSFFINPFPKKKNEFKVGMRMEGRDPQNESLICVLNVVEVQGYRLRLNFDSYDSCYDFWRTADSKYIYPMGYCKLNNLVLNPPRGYHKNDFDWCDYLKKQNLLPAPKELFNKDLNSTKRNIKLLKIGMKLEAVDKHNPIFIRVATIIDIKNDKLKIRYDGWPSNYDAWFNKDSEDLYPCNWCQHTGYVLSKPLSLKYYTDSSNSCPVLGCNGVGHVKGLKYKAHYEESDCPYFIENLNKKFIPERLEMVSLKRRIENFDKMNKKRGRPSKKSKDDKLKYEIRESVYLLENYNDDVNIKDTIHFKIDSQLVNGLDLIEDDINNIQKWSINKVCAFINKIPGCENLSSKFENELIDGEALVLMELSDLVKLMNLKFGPALKIFNYINKIKVLK